MIKYNEKIRSLEILDENKNLDPTKILAYKDINGNEIQLSNSICLAKSQKPEDFYEIPDPDYKPENQENSQIKEATVELDKSEIQTIE